MKKILFILIMFTGTINISAQENNEAILQKIDSLQSQLNKLQIDCEFHKLHSELQGLNTDLKIYCNDMNSKSNGMLISCYQGNANETLYEAYKEGYDANVSLLNSYKEAFGVTKTSIYLKTNEIEFTDQQLSIFGTGINTLNAAINAADSALNYYKTVMSMYKDLMR